MRPSASRCYPIGTVRSKSMHVEKQFLKWVLDWEMRVFPTKLNEQNRYCFSIFKCQEMNNCIQHYQTQLKDELGQDRLAWTVFAKALLAEHDKNCGTDESNLHRLDSRYPCSVTRCLYVLVWISYYLNLSNSALVQSVLRAILLCTQNFKFLFTFLPGMMFSVYISQFLEDSDDFEDSLCQEFFSLIYESACAWNRNKTVYSWFQPLFFQQITNLSPVLGSSPLPPISNSNSFLASSKHTYSKSTPLTSLLNQGILSNYKHNILTLAIEFNDTPLVNKLLQLGASAGHQLWDPVKEEITTPERMMISNINSVMSSLKILSGNSNISNDILNGVLKKKEAICTYAKKINRSLLHPESLKANDMWDGEKWKIELNKDIADEWGIGCKRPVPSLQHMVKICVRSQIILADNKLLPFAIKDLPLPYLLKAYLNLELD